ncbi:MAG TPA: 1-(5-phosphoribosyl)-5-[(5-phosphoribosylamino)methylideneamino]imidazole-4-carboxamide isomerase [Gemmatimonadales bacterium]|nr:1-(5-phosphoribosyl)-5-[(5-phosphoribosylamino)methylideneamino]imidazole-4-carboxamide isomerase [Gemmatimonadales bacterium]
MDLLPAIDIRNGRVVRLSQGERARQTVYGDDPLSVADRFVDQGASWIHLVDLDRAFGTGENQVVIKTIADRLATKVRLQLGGGLRSGDLIRAGLDLGLARVVIGTAAAIDPSFVPEMVGSLGADRLAVGIDARNGRVALRGWTETSSRRVEDLARQVVRDGIETIIYTDIGRDGMLVGPDLPGAVALRTTGAKVVVSGGVSSTGDIESACEAGLAGVIVGKALYEGRVNLAEALHAATC